MVFITVSLTASAPTAEGGSVSLNVTSNDKWTATVTA